MVRDRFDDQGPAVHLDVVTWVGNTTKSIRDQAGERLVRARDTGHPDGVELVGADAAVDIPPTPPV